MATKDRSKSPNDNAAKAKQVGKQGSTKKRDSSVKDKHLPAEGRSEKSAPERKPNGEGNASKKESMSSTDNTTSTPVIKLDRVARHKIPRHASTFVCIDDVMKENNLATRADAINLMRHQGLAEDNQGKALVVAHRLNGKLVQMIGINDKPVRSNKVRDKEASSSKDTKTTSTQPTSNGKPPSPKDKSKGFESNQSPESKGDKAIDWESVFASDSASIHGLHIKIKNAPKGTLGAYLRGLSDSLEEGVSLSTVAVEYEGKAAIKTIPLLNYINSQRSTPIRYRHIKSAIMKAGEQVGSEKVGIENIVVINGQSINKIQIEE